MSWRRFLRRNWWDGERAREIESYLEIETAENIARGMNPSDAAAAAHRKFGNPVMVREEIYRMNTVGWLESVWQDVRYGARQLCSSPGFAAVAIASLALGIGANTAIFQLLDAVRLRSLPVKNPQELAEVRIIGGNGGMGLNPNRYGGLTRPLWEHIEKHQQSFSSMFAWASGDIRVGQISDLRRAKGIRVSGDFFRTLGVDPWRGRLILPEDEAQSCPLTRAVVSYSYWQGQMGARELDAGSKLMVNGDLVEVIGVTPPQFLGLAVGESFDIALPFCRPREALRRDVFDVSVMGRLRPGWTLEKASAHLEAISPGLFAETVITGYGAEAIGRYKRFKLAAYEAGGGVSQLREQYDSSLWLLLAITGMVLLIACANLANLMLARASVREREVAVRLALGASRRRLLRQLLAESALLAAIGVGLGVAIARFLSRTLVWSLSTENAMVQLPMATDWRIFLFATLVAVLTCAIFGVMPAIRATDVEPGSAMQSGSRGVTGRRERFAIQRLMVIGQISISLVLLVSALLFVRSFRNLMTFHPGMRQAGITVGFFGFNPIPAARDHPEEFRREILDEVRATPGVLAAASTTNVPLIGGSWSHGVRIGSARGGSQFTWVSPSYFETMGIPVLQGRDFTRDDTRKSPRVAVVNQTFVRKYLGGTNPIGQTMRTGEEPNFPSTVYEIVGVIADTKYNNLRSVIPPMTFAPASQYPPEALWANVMIHSDSPTATVGAAVKRRISEKYSGTIMEFVDFQQRIREGMIQERLMAMLSGFFGLLAALLAMVGLYGVISYLVARRRNEIGIRLALGARRGQVIGMVMKEAGRLLLIGIVIGIATSLVAGRAAGAMLFGLKPHDPLTLAGAVILLVAIALMASLVPARRASRLDPMIAIRYE